MNTKLFAQILVAFGTLSLVLALYQFNQYYAAQAAIAPAMSQLDELSASGGLEAAGITQSALDSTRATMTDTSNAMVAAMMLDLVVGIIAIAAGLFLYPRER